MSRPGGKLVTYGPYAQDGLLAPESNQQVENFEETLKQQSRKSFCSVSFHPLVWSESTFTWPLVGDSRHHRTEGGWGSPGAQFGSGLTAPQNTSLWNFSSPRIYPKSPPNDQVIEMPANNKTLVFVKRAAGRLWSLLLQLPVCLFCAFIIRDFCWSQIKNYYILIETLHS